MTHTFRVCPVPSCSVCCVDWLVVGGWDIVSCFFVFVFMLVIFVVVVLLLLFLLLVGCSFVVGFLVCVLFFSLFFGGGGGGVGFHFVVVVWRLFKNVLPSSQYTSRSLICSQCVLFFCVV